MKTRTWRGPAAAMRPFGLHIHVPDRDIFGTKLVFEALLSRAGNICVRFQQFVSSHRMAFTLIIRKLFGAAPIQIIQRYALLLDDFPSTAARIDRRHAAIEAHVSFECELLLRSEPTHRCFYGFFRSGRAGVDCLNAFAASSSM